MQTTFLIASAPPGSSGAAIGIVELAGDIDAVFAALSIRPVGPGRSGLREVPGVDTLVVARLEPDHALLFPHAGPAILRRLARALEGCGAARLSPEAGARSGPPPATAMPHLLDEALSRAASPLAIDLLLDQPRRWHALTSGAVERLPESAERVLQRLVRPPMVVALGPPNIGKSSLLNALAGRSVSIVADEPGTTRDHVGVHLNLAGLVVRYIDAPGISQAGAQPTTAADAAIQAEAQAIAWRLAAEADLLLLCGDSSQGGGFLTVPGVGDPTPALRVALRTDLGVPVGLRPDDLRVSVHRGTGLEELVLAIRERLVPAAVRADPRAWAFWTSG
jgi:tRNA modification GTPase